MTMFLTAASALGESAAQWSASNLTPFIFAGVSGALAIACALAALTLRRRVNSLRAAKARAEAQVRAADLSLERIFFVGPEGGLKPATAATEADARALARSSGRAAGRLIDRMFGRETVRRLGPLLEALAQKGEAFEFAGKDGAGEPTLYIGDVIGGQALLRVWPDGEPTPPVQETKQGPTRDAIGALQNAPVGVLIFDDDARLLSMNTAARRLFRIRPERMQDNPSLRALIDGLREAGRVPERDDFTAWRAAVLQDPAKALSQDGLWVLGNGDALRVSAEPAQSGGFIVYVQDETSAVGLERRYHIALGARRATLAAMNEGVAVVGADSRMQLINPAFARMWSAPPALCDERSAGEASFSDIMAIATRDAPRQAIDLWTRIEAALRAPAPRRSETFEADKGDGARLQLLTTPLPDGATLIIMRDVTEAHLGAAALRARADSLEESDGLKTEFLNNIAYQLRTPLNAALGFTDMLLSGMAGSLSDTQHEYVACAHAAADELREIVHDALDLGALTVGSAELVERTLDLGVAAHAVSNSLKTRAERRGAYFRASISGHPAPFVGDDVRLRHALYSVAIAILARAMRSDAINLRFTVEDETAYGDALAVIEISLSRAQPGMTEDEPLSEEENVSFRLARRIVEAHGGALSIMSNTAGASARFEFPLSAAFTRLDLDPATHRPGSERDDAA